MIKFIPLSLSSSYTSPLLLFLFQEQSSEDLLRRHIQLKDEHGDDRPGCQEAPLVWSHGVPVEDSTGREKRESTAGSCALTPPVLSQNSLSSRRAPCSSLGDPIRLCALPCSLQEPGGGRQTWAQLRTHTLGIAQLGLGRSRGDTRADREHFVLQLVLLLKAART